jgi:predicted nucleotide-binding protein
MNEWRMFIASSVKGHRYAEAIKSVIDAKFGRVVCSLWDLGAFEAGRSFLDSLERLPTKYNCGLAVFTADDPLSNLTMAPRDNVVLEFGLFLGVFGRDRSCVVVVKRDDR